MATTVALPSFMAALETAVEATLAMATMGAVGALAIIAGGLLARGDEVQEGEEGAKQASETTKHKVPRPGLSGKEGAKDVPSWARGYRPNVGESGKDFAARLMNEKYGPGNWKGGSGSEFGKIQKWGDRAFTDPS